MAGAKTAAAEGDYVLANDRVRVVIDEPGHPQGLAPSGGSIIDMTVVGPDPSDVSGDQLNGISHAAGVLPRDGVRYRRAEMIDGAPDFVALIVRGHLDGNERVQVVTRYELRPCEFGVRVRTELWNGSPEVNTFYLTDGLFWGDRGLLPFIPISGHGFQHPELDLLKLGASWRHWPFLAARAQAEPATAYAVVPCDPGHGEGFNSSTLSATGIARTPTLPQDGRVYERFILVAPGPGLARVVGQALRARGDFHGEPMPAKVRGRLVAGAAPVPFDGRGGRAASLLFYEPAHGHDPDVPERRRPWSEAVPGADGIFEVELPPNRRFRVQPHAFGRPAGGAVSLKTGASESTVHIGDVLVDRPARVLLTVMDEMNERPAFAEVVVEPVVPLSGDAPSLYGQGDRCAPLLGPPHGGSPACNRALVVAGSADLLVPPGRHYIYVTRGPFAGLTRAEVDLAPGQEHALTLRSVRLPMLRPGWLSADFHVHGGASYDSSMPDADRVISFLASGIDVVAATDHDVVVTYEETISLLGVSDQLVVMPGVEATPNILWFRVPGEEFPKTLGHFNFWPLRADRFAPRGGAPWDELLEPGALMDSMEPYWQPREAAVRQMNHPWAEATFGRDQGFLRVIKYDPRKPVIQGRGFAAEVLLRAPGGGRRNLDFDVQEVMTGADRHGWLRARELWFSFLNQGILRAGTANSDTHTFAVEPAGYPRNVITGNHRLATFDVVAFNRDVRSGNMIGTNGPVLYARLVEQGGSSEAAPSLVPITPTSDARILVDVDVVPWIPVSEIRFVVNGRVVKKVPVRLDDGERPFGDNRHIDVNVHLAELVSGVRGDAWVVVEAGLGLPAEENEGDMASNPPRPQPDHPRYHLDVIAPGTWPYAFSNPFLLDLDGGQWTPPGL